MQTRPGSLLIAHPSADLYGADLQMLESVSAAREDGWRVVVALPGDGPLVRRLLARGAEVRHVRYPVLRRSAASLTGLPVLGLAAARAVPAIRAVVRDERPDAVYVNTVTLPWWLLATRSLPVPTLCHVHEAEAADRPAVRRALAAPLGLADAVVVNSRTTRDVVLEAAPRLRSRTTVLHNGVGGPPAPLGPPRLGRDGRRRIVVVGRLSPRKSPHTAMAAVALLRERGYDVEIDLVGTAGPGQERYVESLRGRAAERDLREVVRFVGYCDPVWSALEAADVLVAPSLGESFGNAVVEGQLAGRPVVATAVQGHCETVTDGKTGLLVPPQDASAMADAIAGLLDAPQVAQRLALAGRASAEQRFSARRYRQDLAAVLSGLTSAPAAQARSASVPA